jgi:hypothetical protein
MHKTIEVIYRRIAAHEAAAKTLRELIAELEVELPAAAPNEQHRPTAPASSMASGVPAASAGTQKMGRPARKNPPAVITRTPDPLPPPGISVRERIAEHLAKGPMTSADLIAATGCVPVTVYQTLAKMRSAGAVTMIRDEADGQQKNSLAVPAVSAAQETSNG